MASRPVSREWAAVEERVQRQDAAQQRQQQGQQQSERQGWPPSCSGRASLLGQQQQQQQQVCTSLGSRAASPSGEPCDWSWQLLSHCAAAVMYVHGYMVPAHASSTNSFDLLPGAEQAINRQCWQQLPWDQQQQQLQGMLPGQQPRPSSSFGAVRGFQDHHQGVLMQQHVIVPAWGASCGGARAQSAASIRRPFSACSMPAASGCACGGALSQGGSRPVSARTDVRPAVGWFPAEGGSGCGSQRPSSSAAGAVRKLPPTPVTFNGIGG